MKVDTVRKVDYYAGVPLCFFATVIKKCRSLLSRANQQNKPKNILFIELSEMGSAILADPAMLKLKHTLNANLYFAIFRRNSASLDLLRTIPRENVFIMSDDGLLNIAIGAFKFLFWTRKNNIDTTIDLELFSRFSALLTGFSGAQRTVGFHAFYNEGLYRGDLLTHKVAYNPHLHIAKNFVALANAVLSPRAEVPYSKTVVPDEEISLRKVVVSEEAKGKMRTKISHAFPRYSAEQHQIVLFNTNASELVPLRRWPQAYYTTLAKTILHRYPNVVILLTGDGTERSNKDIIVAEVNSDRCVNFAGQTSVSDLPALYSVSDFMLTNDSGPAHFAAVTDMPVFVLFGPETPKIYAPLGAMTPLYAGLACSPCVSAANHRKTPCRDNVCLQTISPEQVLQSLLPVLNHDITSQSRTDGSSG